MDKNCTIELKGLVDEDFINYKKPSMFISFPKCSFKCDKECGSKVCQNSSLATSPSVFVEINKLVHRYLSNPITRAIVIGGLEPFDSPIELFTLIDKIRENTDDDIVIYTGYTENELTDKIIMLSLEKNIIIKFGRFIPNQNSHYDSVLGVNLSSGNQYAKVISNV